MILPFYATKLSNGYIFGNDLSFTLKMTYFTPNITGIYISESDSYARYPQEDTTDYFAWRKPVYGGYEYIYTKLDPSIEANKPDYIASKNTIDVYKDTVNGMVLQEEKVVLAVYEMSSTEKEIEQVLTRSETGTGATISPIVEQRIGEDAYAKNVANITNYNKSLVVYPNFEQTLWKFLLVFYNMQDLRYIKEVKLIKRYSNGYEFDYKQIILNYNENIALGSPLTFTLTLGDIK